MSSTVERSGEDPASPEEASGASNEGSEKEAAAATEEPATIHDTAPKEEEAARPDTAGIVVEVESDDEIEVEVEDPAAATAALISDLEAKVRDHYQRLVRTTADFENFRKRSRREIGEARVDEQSRVLREMLPVIDNLERALAVAVGDTPGFTSLRQGIELVLRQFTQSLEKFQVVRIVAKGAMFDPNLHEAVSQAETADHPPGTIVEVLQPGYLIGERLLRAALSVVAKAPPEPEAEVTAPEPAAAEPVADAPAAEVVAEPAAAPIAAEQADLDDLADALDEVSDVIELVADAEDENEG